MPSSYPFYNPSGHKFFIVSPLCKELLHSRASRCTFIIPVVHNVGHENGLFNKGGISILDTFIVKVPTLDTYL